MSAAGDALALRRAERFAARVAALVATARKAKAAGDADALGAALASLAPLVPPLKRHLASQRDRQVDRLATRKLRHLYPRLLSKAKHAHDYFRNSFTGLHRKIAASDVAEYLSRFPAQQGFASYFGRSWGPELATELGEDDASKWVTFNLAEHIGVGDRTLRGRLYGAKKRTKTGR